MRVFAIISVALCLADVQSAAQRAPVFKSNVELASLDVTVTDTQGAPISGLRPEEFTATIDGRRVPVEALEYIPVEAAIGTSLPAANRASGAPTPSDGNAFRVVVFMVDDLSMPARPLQAVMQPALEMLSMLGPNDLAGVVSTSGLGPVVNPTRDRSAVKGALLNKALSGRALRRAGRFVIGADEAVQVDEDVPGVLDNLAERECQIANTRQKVVDPICETELQKAAKDMAQADVYRSQQQLQAFERVVNALRGGPSPKVLVVISAGLVVRTRDQETVHRIDQLSRMAAVSGVIVYGLGEAPAFSSVEDQTMDRAAAMRNEANFLNTGLQTAVSATGGESFLIVGQPKRFVERIMRETSAYYRLGVRLPADDAGGAFQVQVTTTHPGASVRANRHVIPPARSGK